MTHDLYRTPPRSPAQKRFDSKMRDATKELTRRVAQAQEKLLRDLFASGLPIENADPKFEIQALDPTKPHVLNVKVWIDWKDRAETMKVEL